MSTTRVFPTMGIEITAAADRKQLDPRYFQSRPVVMFSDVRVDFMKNRPVPKGFTVRFNGRTYRPGERLNVVPDAPAKAAAPDEPTLDMFAPDPGAPRTTDQNSAFWGLMQKLSVLTGKTPEQMKAVIVARALGENKGTSKLTVDEMDKVIDYVRRTIALFSAQKGEA